MSKQKPMTKAEREKAKKRREQLKDAPTEMRSGSFKLPSKTKLKELRKIRKGKLDGPTLPTPTKKKKQQRIKDKLKIGG